MTEQKTITIKEALGFPDGTPIPRIVGKVGLVWDRTTGEGKWGTWFKQAGLIEDAEGNKMVFTVWDKPDISEYKGRTVIFRAAPNSKKPSMSLKADYKDASKMTLNVGKSSIVLTEEEESDAIPMDYDDQKGQAQGELDRAKAKVATKASPAPKKAPANGVQEVKQRVMQLANLREICDHAANFLYSEEDEDFVKEIGTSLFIQATRENLHDKLPNNKPLSKKENVEASENLEEKEDEIF